MAGASLLLPSSLLLAVILILSPVSQADDDQAASVPSSSPSCATLNHCDHYWSQCSATCTGVKRATVCCPPTSSTLQLCRERCYETFQFLSTIQSPSCRCVNGGRRSASGACVCPPGYYGNCCQEKIHLPNTGLDTKDGDEQPDQQHNSQEHGCHGSHENHQHHSGENHHSSCEDDGSDDGQGQGSSSQSSLHAGAMTAIVIVTLGSLVAAGVLIAALCHRRRAAAAVAAAAGATSPVVVVKPPVPAVYTIDVKEKKMSADDVTASPPPYWQAIDASAPPSYQSYMALNEVGLDDQARSAARS